MHQNNTKCDYLLLILVFGLGLDSYYSYSLSVPLVSLLASLGLVCYSTIKLKQKIEGSNTVDNLQIFYLFTYGYSLSSGIFLGDILGAQIFAAILIPLLILSLRICIGPHLIAKALIFTISFHLFFFFLQFFAYILFDIHLDFLESFDGEAQRIFGGSHVYTVIGKLIIRPSGLFNEPGTYAVFIAPLVVCLRLLYAQANRTVNFLFFFGLLSLLLSLSSQGIVSFFVIIASHLLVSPKKTSFISLFSLISLMASFLFFVLPYIQYRFFGTDYVAGTDTGISLRQEIFNQFFYGFQIKYPLWPNFGPGILAADPVPNDLSLILFMFFKLGIFPSIVIFLLFLKSVFQLLIAKSKKKLRNHEDVFLLISLFLIISFTKFNPFSISGATVLGLCAIAFSPRSLYGPHK